MSNDGYTELNLGSGGSFMDETVVSHPSPPVGEPTERQRTRIQVGGCEFEELAEVLNTEPIDTDYGLVVRVAGNSAISLPGLPVSEFGSITSISENTETTVASYIVPVGKIFHAVGFVASGTVNARFNFYIDGVLKMVSRSTAAQQTVDHGFQLVGPTGSGGVTVAIKAIHERPNINADFEATILGYIV